jgi:hypothetical protein
MPKIFQAGYMSGDTYTASAYLALDTTARVLLLKDTKEPQDKTDKVVYKFYTECGLTSRVLRLDLSGTTIAVKDLWKAFNEAPSSPPTRIAFSGPPQTIPQALSYLYYNADPKNEWPRSIVSVTGFVASKFESDSGGSAKKVADLWKIGKFDTDTKFKLWEFAGKRFAKTGFDIRKNILVLWSRQSGKKGGAHFELDTSYQGIRQLVGHFAPAKATVVLAGDERNGKLAEIASGSPQVVNVAGMWDDQFWKDNFASVNVLAQLALFKFLAEDYNVVHLGMRSGMLETMALLGMKVFYMEPAPCPSGTRMLAFQRVGIPYSRIQIKEPPGLTGLAGQQAIVRGVKAPSLQTVQDQIDRNATNIKRYRPFSNYYGDYNRSTRTVRFDETGEKAARDYGKAKLVGREDQVGVTDGTVISDTKKLRGFLTSDFDAIIEKIEAAFVS